MQNYNDIADNDYVSNGPNLINNNIKTVMSENAGSDFPAGTFPTGTKCFRTDEQAVYRLDAEGGWVKEYDLRSEGGIIVAYATNAGQAAGADEATKLAAARTITVDLASTTAASFDGSANVKPGVKGVLPITQGGTGATTAADALANLGGVPIVSGAAAHNGIFRGKYLGASVTSAQRAAIKAGTFDDLYIGDYWTINGVDYVIVAFDYYYGTGDAACTQHHVVCVPRKSLYTAQMNTSDVATGAYVGSAMYTTNLNTAKNTITAAFGADHLLTIRQLFQNSVASGGYENSVGEWYDATVWLMNEFNVYGGLVWKNAYAGANWRGNYTIDNSQYPGFALDLTMLHPSDRVAYWLRDVASSVAFASVSGRGYCYYNYASTSAGVRPAFCVH